MAKDGKRVPARPGLVIDNAGLDDSVFADMRGRNHKATTLANGRAGPAICFRRVRAGRRNEIISDVVWRPATRS